MAEAVEGSEKNEPPDILTPQSKWLQTAKKGLYKNYMEKICLKSAKLKNITREEAEQIRLWTAKIKLQSIEITRLSNMMKTTIYKIEAGDNKRHTRR